MRETIGGSEQAPPAGAVCFKPAGTAHADHWGPAGTLILSLNLPAVDREVRARLVPGRWTPMAGGAVRALVRGAFGRDSRLAPADLIPDLLASAMPPPAPRRPRPRWLDEVKAAIDDGEALSAADAARRAGVHRVHLSRAFAQHFGLPLSLYRQQLRTARAVAAMLGGATPLSDIALGAGFADQSHMTRAVTAATGLSPRHLRTRLRG